MGPPRSLLLVGLVLFGVGCTGTPSSSGRPAPPPTVAPPGADPGPVDILVALDRIWVLNSGRLDVYDKHLGLVARVRVGSRVESLSDGPVLGAGGGSLWVGFAFSDTLYRVDPDTYRVTAAVSAVDNPGRMTAVGDVLWVAQDRTGNLTKVDMKANRVVAMMPVAGPTPGAATSWAELRWQERTLDPVRIGSTGHLVWVQTYDAVPLVVVDTGTGAIVARHDCRGLTVVGGVPTATCDRRVVWFDPTTGALTRSTPTPDWLGVGPLNIVAEAPGGWIAAPQDKGLVRVDRALRPTAATGVTPGASATRMAALDSAIVGIVGSTVFRFELS